MCWHFSFTGRCYVKRQCKICVSLCLQLSNDLFLQWPIPDQSPASFQWGSFSGPEFCDTVSYVYDEIIHWKRNLFQVPSGSSGKAFVLELSCLYQAYADSSSLESVTLKARSVLVALILQKPNRTSKSKDHVAHLNHRIALWKEGNLSALLDEGQCIQRHLRFCDAPYKDRAARIFNNLMLQGKVYFALCYLSCHSSGGVLNLDAQLPVRSFNGDMEMTTVHRVLLYKHPLGRPPHPSTLLDSIPDPVNLIIFDGVNADAIHSASLQTAGAAGPLGLDATAWCRLCCSFKSASVALCSILAAVGHCLCTEALYPDGPSYSSSQATWCLSYWYW